MRDVSITTVEHVHRWQVVGTPLEAAGDTLSVLVVCLECNVWEERRLSRNDE